MRHTQGDASLIQFHQDAFAPLPPRSLADLQWYLNAFLGLFSGILGFDFRWLTLCGFLFLAGLRVSWARDRFVCLGLLAPITFTLLASALHRYPWADRLLLFAAPFIVVLLGEGMVWMQDMLRASWRHGSALLTEFMAVPFLLSALRPIRAMSGPPAHYSP